MVQIVGLCVVYNWVTFVRLKSNRGQLTGWGVVSFKNALNEMVALDVRWGHLLMESLYSSLMSRNSLWSRVDINIFIYRYQLLQHWIYCNWKARWHPLANFASLFQWICHEETPVVNFSPNKLQHAPPDSSNSPLLSVTPAPDKERLSWTLTRT